MTMRRYRPWILGSSSFVLIGVVWELAVQVGLFNPFLTSSPSLVAAALVEAMQDGQLLTNISATVVSLATGFAMAALVGISIGIAMGWYRYAEWALDPYVWLGYAAPTIAFYPLFILFLGLGSPTVIALTFLFGVFPIIINTVEGVKNVDRTLQRAAHSFGAGDRQMFSKVVLPASVPMVMAGLRLGAGRSLLGGIVGELFGGNAGLGYAISQHASLMRTDLMMLHVLMVMVLGVVVTQSLRWLQSRFDVWRPEIN